MYIPYVFDRGEDFNKFVVLLHTLFNMSQSFPSMIHFQDILDKKCNKTTNLLKSSPHQKSVHMEGTSLGFATAFAVTHFLLLINRLV